MHEDIEQGLAQAVRGRPDRLRLRRRQRAPAQAAADDAHLALSPLRPPAALGRALVERGPRAFAATRALKFVLFTHRLLALFASALGLLGGSARRRRRSRNRRLPRMHDWRGEIRACEACELLAELFAQDARRHLADLAFGDLAQLKWPERDADQPRHMQSEMAQHVAHLAILALADRECDPHVRGLLAVERRLD